MRHTTKSKVASGSALERNQNGGPCSRLSNLRTEKNRLVYVRFSDQIPRTGPGPCYKYLRELRDRRADLSLRLSSPSSRFLSPRRKCPLSFSLFSRFFSAFFLSFRLDVAREKGRLRESERKKQEPVLRVSTSAGTRLQLPAERLAMPIRFSLALRVFEQFSCTEDPAVSSPLSRDENRREREGGRIRERGEKRPVKKDRTVSW